MPTRIKTLRPRGAPTRVEMRRATDGRRRERLPWRALYNTAQWKTLRADQLAREPLCRMCEADGQIVPATVCDHVDRHAGDPVKFFAGPFQSLCKWHHDSTKQRLEAAQHKGRGGSKVSASDARDRPFNPHKMRAEFEISFF